MSSRRGSRHPLIDRVPRSVIPLPGELKVHPSAARSGSGACRQPLRRLRDPSSELREVSRGGGRRPVPARRTFMVRDCEDPDVPLRKRVSRLSWLAAALIALLVILVAVACWGAAHTVRREMVGQLPLGTSGSFPSASAILAAGAAAAAFFVGLAALYAAAAMRVLARDRRIPPPSVAGDAHVAGRPADAVGAVDGPASGGARAASEQAAGRWWRGCRCG